MEEKFKNWLIQESYREFSQKRNPSTVYDYCKRVSMVIENEKLGSWEKLADNIGYYVKIYGPDGAKEKEGEKSHRSVINALRAFERFLKTV
ncbi:MAG: hypothetical protein K2J83_07165 [Clostridia bacterium]|nr:hypothetical protein [Clostridia bacterium]